MTLPGAKKKITMTVHTYPIIPAYGMKICELLFCMLMVYLHIKKNFICISKINSSNFVNYITSSTKKNISTNFKYKEYFHFHFFIFSFLELFKALSLFDS